MNWTDHAEDIRSMYEANTPLAVMAAKYGTCPGHMGKVITKLGIPRRSGPGVWRNHIPAIRARYEAGETLTEIGASYNRNAAQMSKLIARFGFRRPRFTPPSTRNPDWPSPTLSEREFEARLIADGGFPRYADTINRFGDRVITPEKVWDVRGRRAA